MNTDILFNELKLRIPGFEAYALENILNADEGSISILSDFGIYLRNSISKNNKEVELASFQLINGWLNLDNSKLDNWIKISVFEILTDTKESQDSCLTNLNSKGKLLFSELFKTHNKLSSLF